MKNSHTLWLIGIALIPAFVVTASAQRGSSGRANPDATRTTINDETFRELMKMERENRNPGKDNSEVTRALLKQTSEDFKALQNINNKMMAQVYATETIDYDRTSAAIAQINTKAIRLKNNLSLPNSKDVKKKDLTVSGAKEFKSALLLMDRSIMGFVTNPIFQKPNVIEVESAKRASQDLEDIITLSTTLKRIADNLKSSTSKH
jgi:uncharacterized lipoprotein YehR (DUF1307 family)